MNKVFLGIILVFIISLAVLHTRTSLHTAKINAENEAFKKECEERLWKGRGAYGY